MKNIIFLGAGASKADGAPLQNELFKEYFTMKLKQKTNNEHQLFDEDFIDNFTPMEIKVEKEVKQFFYDFFGINDYNNYCNYPTFEEALGILDLAIDRKEHFFRLNETYNLDLFKQVSYQSIRLALILAMSEVIEYSLRESTGYTHLNLLHNLQKRNDFALISTNYDILIDKSILEIGKDIDYGFNYNEQAYFTESIPLFKIHGSLNWLYCPVCKKIKITHNLKSMLSLVGVLYGLINAVCPNCHSLMESVIIPPSFFKDYQNMYSNNIWNNAEQQLSNAQKIIFCGYSFPDADIYIKYLLKRVEMINRNNVSYYVVNNHTNKSESDKILEQQRYQRFFHNKNKVVFTELSFEDFSNNPNILLDMT